ncbi:MAG TPA: SRPBCC family protein, partial [Polyangiaceae bacterium]|nr:SRPBCC family protein [Polyangiaceae bacterium]
MQAEPQSHFTAEKPRLTKPRAPSLPVPERTNGANGTPPWRWLRIGLETVAVLALFERTLESRRKRKAGLIATTTALAAVAALDGLSLVRHPRVAPLRLQVSVTINRSPEDVYAFWRNFKNLPGFMRHLDEVDEFDGLTIWRAQGPGGIHLQWDAAIVADRPNERIAWRSLEGASVQNFGSVTFLPGPRGRGTELHVSMGFEPPFGKMGGAILGLLGKIPEQQLLAD